MSKKTLVELLDDLVLVSNCEVCIYPGSNLAGYLVLILDENSFEVANEEDESLYTAVLHCWRALCG